MADLTARLTEALNRAEQQASSINVDSGWYEPGDLSRSHREGGAGLPDFDEPHIVAWSPQRVLALIARDRALLAAHVCVEPDDPARMLDDLRGGWCARCIPDDEPDATLLMPWPCETVQLVAAFWLAEEPACRHVENIATSPAGGTP